MRWGRVAETEIMPRLVESYTEPGCSKWKSGKGFLEPNFGVLPKLDSWGVGYDEYYGLACCFQVHGRAFIEFPKNSMGRCIARSDAKRGLSPGVIN